MNIAMQIDEHFRSALRSYERRAEVAHEDYESRLEWIAERSHQIVDEMIERWTPPADRALRDALECSEFDGLTYDLLHALLWQPTAADSVARADALKTKLVEIARDSYTLNSHAAEQAQREWETRHE